MKGAMSVMAVLPAVIQAGEGVKPLPAEPPIGGPLWTVVLPGVLLLGALLGTWLLYRAFAGSDDSKDESEAP